MMWCRLFPLLLCCWVGYGFPDGTPESACVDMMPGIQPGVVGLEGHLASPQNVFPTYGNTKKPPYYLQLHKTDITYTPGEEIHISIIANQTVSSLMYKGILLQARRVVCASSLGMDNETLILDEEPIGTFKSMSGNLLLRTMECGGIPNSAVSHKSPQYKINETVTWIPESSTGHIIFKATIVQHSYIYWTNIHSSILIDPTQELAPLTCSASRTEGYTIFLFCLMLFHTVLHTRERI